MYKMKETTSNVKTPAKSKIGGFTLIELLVVVLIIGILAAVAYPQYRFMVLRAETARALPLLKSLRDAQDRYFMANGTYAQKFEDLDIKMPCEEEFNYVNYSTCTLESRSRTYFLYSSGGVRLDIGKDPLQERVYIYYYPESMSPAHVCYAATAPGDNSPGNKLCKGLGGVLLRTGTQSGCNGGQGCHYYALP